MLDTQGLYEQRYERGELVRNPDLHYHRLGGAWNAGADSGAGMDMTPEGDYPNGSCYAPGRDPRCYKNGLLICNMVKTARNQNNQAGSVVYTITMSPQRYDYIEAAACRMTMRDQINPAVDRSEGGRLTAVQVNGRAREDIDDAAPTIASDFIPVTDFVVPDHYAVPVPWGPFGTPGETKYTLVSTFFSTWAAAVTFNHAMVVYGRPVDQNSAVVRRMIRSGP